MARLVLGLLAGLLAGLGVGYLLAARPPRVPDGAPAGSAVGPSAPGPSAHAADGPGAGLTPVEGPSVSRSAAARPGPAGGGPEEAPATEQRRTPAAPGPHAEHGLLCDHLLPFVDEQLAAGWSNARPDELDGPALAEGRERVEAMLRSYPARIGYLLAEERTASEQLELALSGGDATDILTLIEDDRLSTEQVEGIARMAEDRAGLRALFNETGGGVTVAGAGLRDWNQLEANTTISFGAGVYELTPAGRELPAGVTVVGAGMDATLLVLMNDSWSSRAFDSLELRDATVFTNHNYLFDQRAPASLTLRRVRVVGFDMGAGASVALAFGEGLVLDATDCRFLGGYGGFPHGGSVLRGGTVVARFERCLIADAELGDWDGGSNLVFVDCRLERILGTEYGLQGVQLLGATTLTPFPEPPGNEHVAVEQRDLDELFPDWQQRLR